MSCLLHFPSRKKLLEFRDAVDAWARATSHEEGDMLEAPLAFAVVTPDNVPLANGIGARLVKKPKRATRPRCPQPETAKSSLADVLTNLKHPANLPIRRAVLDRVNDVPALLRLHNIVPAALPEGGIHPRARLVTQLMACVLRSVDRRSDAAVAACVAGLVAFPERVFNLPFFWANRS